MQDFRRVKEAEVVLAFLRGEIESQRFGNEVKRAVLFAGGLQLVQSPDLDSETENLARERALAQARGWRSRDLFQDFPEEVDWYHGLLSPDVLERVRYIDYSYWNELSGGSRRPRDVVETLRSGTLPDWLKSLGTDWCFEFAEQLETAQVVEDVIVVATPNLSELVVLEGHARLTAIFVGNLQRRLRVSAYLGISSEINHWDCF
jgi:hypothetical protein